MNPAYHDTIFEYIPAETISDFWVTTAYNPDGETVAHADNIEADNRLLAEVTGLGFTPFRIIGLDRKEEHAEPGWGIPCDEATALEIGRRYSQEAVFHFTSNRIDLVDCKTGERHPLDEPTGRIRDPRNVRHFTLFVGSSPEHEKFDPQEYEEIRNLIGKWFADFTIQHADGCFRSGIEATLLVHISTRETVKVIRLAHNLRTAFKQTGIGISHNGIYQRVREWADDGLILQSFGLTGQ